MECTTPTQQTKLAKLAGTSRTYLYQLANGMRKASSTLAAQLEKAAETLNYKEHTGLLPRYHVCKTCNECRHVKSRENLKKGERK